MLAKNGDTLVEAPGALLYGAGRLATATFVQALAVAKLGGEFFFFTDVGHVN